MQTDRQIKHLCITTVLYLWVLISRAATGVVVAETNTPTVTIPPIPRIERAVFVVEHEEGRGSGFLLQQTGIVFFVSNMHVLSGGSRFSIKNVYGESISVPNTVQVASDRDLIRFPVPYKGGLLLSQDYGFGDKICAIGNSGGEGVLTRLDGKVMALGPKLVEISSQIIPGNSGGPVLDQSNQVVGVSTYVVNHKDMPEWIIKGSRFTETRRMAARIDTVEWITMSWEKFCSEAAYVKKVKNDADEMIGIVKSLSDDPYKMIYSEIANEDIQKWLKSHNQDVRTFGSRLEKVQTGTMINYRASASTRSSFRQQIRLLAELLENLNEGVGPGAVSLPYFKEELERYGNYFDQSRQHMETVIETML